MSRFIRASTVVGVVTLCLVGTSVLAVEALAIEVLGGDYAFPNKIAGLQIRKFQTNDGVTPASAIESSFSIPETRACHSAPSPCFLASALPTGGWRLRSSQHIIG
jgi:hypothetical protein